MNGTIVTFMEKSTFKAHIDFRGSVPLKIKKKKHHEKLDYICGTYFDLSYMVFSNGNITMETSSLKVSMASLHDFWPFFAIFLFQNWGNSFKTDVKWLQK